MFSADGFTQRSYTWRSECLVPSFSAPTRCSTSTYGSSDLAGRLRGTKVALPIDGRDVTVTVGDKVVASLRTKDRREAKLRFQHAATRLDAFFRAARAAPATLFYRDVVALSGDAYRDVTAREHEVGPDHFDEASAAFEDEVRSFQYDGETPLARDDAEFLATLALPDGPAILAWTGGGLDFGCLTMSEEQGLEQLFGRKADAIAAKRELRLDPRSRISLLKEIGRTLLLGTKRLKQVAGGDFSPDPHLARFPDFRGGEKVTVAELFSRWKTHNADKVEGSTIRRYTPTMTASRPFCPPRMSAGSTRTTSGPGPSIAATSTGSQHARSTATISSRRPRSSPSPPRATASGSSRPIRSGASSSTPPRRSACGSAPSGLRRSRPSSPSRAMPRSGDPIPRLRRRGAGCRRSAPISALLVVKFPQTKDGNARVVPLHDALIEEGLATFVEAAPHGFLFVDGKPREGTKDRTIQEVRASQLATCIRKNVDLDEGVDPNHGWRHTWISIASSDGVAISKRHQNAINGHNKNKDASYGYCAFPIRELKIALDKFPRYRL